MNPDQSKPTPLTDNLRGLERGWDSYGARPISNPVLKLAEQIEHGLAFVPTSNGGFQIEFHAADIDVEIGFDHHAELHGVYVSRTEK